MTELCLSIGEPFTSPAWGSNFVLFSGGQLIPEDQSKQYLSRVCKYARAHMVYLVPDRFVLMGHPCMCLVSPQGKVLGAQKAVFAKVGESWPQGGELEVISTEFGGIMLCVDVDAYHPEVGRIGLDMGAQIIICNQYIEPEDYNSGMVLTGVWNMAQANKVYVLAVCNMYHCVCGPAEMTPKGNGFVARPTLKTPLTGRVRVERLLKCKQQVRLGRKFYGIHKNDFFGVAK